MLGATKFRAVWEGPLVKLSAAVTLLIAGSAWAVWSAADLPDGPRLWVTAAIVATPLAAALFTVRGYALQDGVLLVRRGLWSTRIPLADLTSAEHDPEALRGAWRLFGNGGLYAYSGLYWSRRLGRFRAFVTDRGDCVVLKLGERTLVVSPDTPEHFVNALRASVTSRP